MSDKDSTNFLIFSSFGASVKKIQLKGGFCSQMVKTRLTLAVMQKDDISPEKKVIGDVFLNTSMITKPIIKHSTGYFL